MRVAQTQWKRDKAVNVDKKHKNKSRNCVGFRGCGSGLCLLLLLLLLLLLFVLLWCMFVCVFVCFFFFLKVQACLLIANVTVPSGLLQEPQRAVAEDCRLTHLLQKVCYNLWSRSATIAKMRRGPVHRVNGNTY